MRFATFSMGITILAMLDAMGTSMAERTAPDDIGAQGGFNVFVAKRTDAAGAMTANLNKTISIVPAIIVDNPTTTTKKRRQNSCDKCSLCLSKVGSGPNSRDTLKGVYQQGVYAYQQRDSSFDKCLNRRDCQDCGVTASTYTMAGTTFAPDELKRILAGTTFPSQSYLLNIVYDVTLDATTDNNWVADLAVFLGKPGITYPNADPSNDWHAAAGLDLGSTVGPDFLGLGYPLISLNEFSNDPGNCFTSSNLPVQCRARIQTPLCTRYTFAAEKKNYPLANIDSTSFDGFDGFFAAPTSPTLCFPVTEFDLSKYPIYIGNTWIDEGTYSGTVTIFYTKFTK